MGTDPLGLEVKPSAAGVGRVESWSDADFYWNRRTEGRPHSHGNGPAGRTCPGRLAAYEPVWQQMVEQESLTAFSTVSRVPPVRF